ncbi:hypothetical protein DFJ67_4382 [Asanoa ferruginea]|uniref:Antibiotic biosynthesis monooxygenase n=1 Tax=Asanoa ferruginea TaxID=53367 RepID=A0A3D9ZM48_9ACTN|nr:hypothetical protein [Asanoa ferruginea]REF98365.1 hypothetical protein DFJ67_4382 [Asanoa ferruginea]GIF51258.1 hypothetical protein Afe04nite_57970 [Asanoa ferruginea]
MSVVRITRFTANTPDTDGMLAKRAELIATVRAAFPGPTATMLTRAADDTWTDAWTWESADHADAAGAARLPLAAEAFALVTVTGTTTVDLVDAS